MKKRIGLTAFSKELCKHLQKEKNPNVRNLTSEELAIVLNAFVEVLAAVLRSGRSVFIERSLSFSRSAIKRSTYNQDRTGRRLIHAMRFRVVPTKEFRNKCEEILTEEQYNAIQAAQKKK